MNSNHKWNSIRKIVFVCWLSFFSASVFAQTADSSFTSLQKAMVNPMAVVLLDLSKNKLDSIPPSIKQLTHLQVLRVSRNRLKYVPAEIGELKQLRELDLGANVIEELPGEIGGLTELSKLILWSNNLDHLPETIKNCTKIEHLDMRAIYINREKQNDIISLMPFDAEVKMSLPCNCD